MSRLLSSLPRGRRLAVSFVLILVLLFLASLPPGTVMASAADGRPAAPATLTPLQHIVFIIKENRTFDNYFGRFAGANGATTYRDPKGLIHALNHTPDPTSSGVGHRWQHARLAWDNGRMDKFSLIPGAIQNGVDVADSQFMESDIPNYWAYARNFVLADTFFSNIMANSFPNHLWTIAPSGSAINDNPFFVGPQLNRWGCDAPAGTLVRQRKADGTVSYIYPCLGLKTLGSLLSQYGISWKYYAPPQDASGYQWSAYNAVAGIRKTSQWTAHVVNPERFEADVAAGTLPAVSWLVPDSESSEHAPHSACIGENWTVAKINAIMTNSALWSTTAIIVTWDDFGGFYDHVPPPVGPNPQISYGFRVPALIISPYARQGVVDHTFYTFLSMLRLAELNFGLPSINNNDRTARTLLNAFDFTQVPRPPLILNPRACPPGPTFSSIQEDMEVGDPQ